MINGVLVERTVKEVLPGLETNSDGLKKVLDELVKQYKRQQEEMEKWKVRFYIIGTLKVTMRLSSGYHSANTTGLWHVRKLTSAGDRKRTIFRLYNSSIRASIVHRRGPHRSFWSFQAIVHYPILIEAAKQPVQIVH